MINASLHYLEAVSNHWTGILDWTTGIDFHTFKCNFSTCLLMIVFLVVLGLGR